MLEQRSTRVELLVEERAIMQLPTSTIAPAAAEAEEGARCLPLEAMGATESMAAAAEVAGPEA